MMLQEVIPAFVESLQSMIGDRLDNFFDESANYIACFPPHTQPTNKKMRSYVQVQLGKINKLNEGSKDGFLVSKCVHAYSSIVGMIGMTSSRGILLPSLKYHPYNHFCVFLKIPLLALLV
jgi:hypothetical protein